MAGRVTVIAEQNSRILQQIAEMLITLRDLTQAFQQASAETQRSTHAYMLRQSEFNGKLNKMKAFEQILYCLTGHLFQTDWNILQL